MRKVILWIAGIFVVLVLVFTFLFRMVRTQTKKHSPEERVEYVQGSVELSVFYNRPGKKGREIFGDLVPYGEVWRTGANEATTFTTNQDLTIDGKTLRAGEYTLWTIPQSDSWTVIFNGKNYAWGVSFGGKASRDPAADVLQVQVPTESLSETVELFTISFEEGAPLKLVLAWDKTRVAVPVQW